MTLAFILLSQSYTVVNDDRRYLWGDFLAPRGRHCTFVFTLSCTIYDFSRAVQQSGVWADWAPTQRHTVHYAISRARDSINGEKSAASTFLYPATPTPISSSPVDCPRGRLRRRIDLVVGGSSMDETIAQQVAFRPLGLTKADLQPVAQELRACAIQHLSQSLPVVNPRAAR